MISNIWEGEESRRDIQYPHVIREFTDVFLEKLPGLPPKREVEFIIDLLPVTTLVAIPPTKLVELKTQLDKRLDLNLNERSVSPWGALALFVKKKDGSMRLCVDYRKLNAIQ